MSNSSIWPIDRSLSDATTLGQKGHRSKSNEGILHIPQSSRTGASPPNSLMSYAGNTLGESYFAAEIQSVYSTAPADLARDFEDRSKRTCYNLYHRHLHFHSFYSSLASSKHMYLLVFFKFHSVIRRDGKVHYSALSLFSKLSLVLVLWPVLGDRFISQNHWEFLRLILQDWFWFVNIPFVRMVKFQFLAQFPVDHLSHPETQNWYIWRPSNKITHEGPNVWRSTVCQVVTEVSIYKLRGKPPECRLRERNWRATIEFPSIRSTNANQTALSVVTLGLFSKELCRFEWKAGWALSPRHSHYGSALPRPVGCKLSHWRLLVLETGCGSCRAQEEFHEKTFHPWIPFLCIFQFTQCEVSENIPALDLALFV